MAKSSRKGKRRMSAGVRAWTKSAAWKAIASAQALANLRAFNARPKCGATAKNTGRPCQRPALANGRCYFHGGKTPAGSGWHKPAFSPGTTPSGTSRLDRKLHDIAQAKKKLAARVAKMTPLEKEAHRKWHDARQPGPKAARISQKVRRQQAIDARIALEAATGSSKPVAEVMRLEERIRDLQRQADLLADEARYGRPPPRTSSPAALRPSQAPAVFIPDGEGIFG